jgi:predicted dehydrogenase
VHQIDLARWWLGAEVRRHRGVGAWVDTYEAPDHLWLHLDHEGGAHTLVEISYSYGHTAKEPRPHFVYELIGDRGMIRYDREAARFELLQPSGTTSLPWDHEKNFGGMYAAFANALATGEAGDLPTAEDGILATRIAREATEQAIRERLR